MTKIMGYIGTKGKTTVQQREALVRKLRDMNDITEFKCGSDIDLDVPTVVQHFAKVPVKFIAPTKKGTIKMIIEESDVLLCLLGRLTVNASECLKESNGGNKEVIYISPDGEVKSEAK